MAIIMFNGEKFTSICCGRTDIYIIQIESDFDKSIATHFFKMGAHM